MKQPIEQKPCRIRVPLQQRGLVEEAGPDVDRVAPVAEVDVDHRGYPGHRRWLHRGGGAGDDAATEGPRAERRAGGAGRGGSGRGGRGRGRAGAAGRDGRSGGGCGGGREKGVRRGRSRHGVVWSRNGDGDDNGGGGGCVW